AGVGGAWVAAVRPRRPALSLGAGRGAPPRRAAAGLGQVALAGGRAAHRAAGGDDVGGTALAQPVAGLGRVAHVARAGAANERTGLYGVRGTGGAGSRAGFGGVARARGRAAHRPRIAGRMLAEVAAAVTGVGRARVAIVGARRAVRLERAIGRAARAGGAVRCAVVAL